MDTPELKKILDHRNRILFDLDEDGARAFVKMHGGFAPKNLNWLTVLHLARMEVEAFPDDIRMDSRMYVARTLGASIATLPPNSKYAHAALDLIFPKVETDAYIAAMEV